MAASRKGSVDLNMVLETIKSECGSIRKDIKEDLQVLRDQISQLDQKLHIRIEQAEQKINVLEKEVEKLTKDSESVSQSIKSIQDRCTMLEIKSMQSMIRLRGMPENPKSDLKQSVLDSLAEFMGIEAEEVSKHLESVYRINSAFALRRQLPRDVIVKFTSKEFMYKILAQQFKNPLIIEEKQVKILKELPRKVLQERREYRKLTDILNQQNIRYKWIFPQGLVFEWDTQRKIISSTGRMHEFLATLDEDVMGAPQTDN